jgi:outer membrane protein assembly factor BamB
MKLRLIACFSLFLAGLFATPQQASAQVPCSPGISPKASLFVNWPQFQYDTAHTGCNPYETILSSSTVGGLKVKWQNQVGEGGFTSGAVVDGVLYTSERNVIPFLLAIDTATGDLIWRLGGQSQLEVFTSPAVAKGVVYFGATDNNVYAVDAKTGTMIWQNTTGNRVNGTPTIANGTVYVGSADNNVYALNAATGALIWKYTTGGEVDYSPAVANGIVYAGSADQKIYALDASTGALIWNYATGSPYCSASVAGGRVYVGSDQVYALDAKTGRLIWNYPAEGTVSPAVANNTVYLTSQDAGTVYALNASTGALIWSYITGDRNNTWNSAAVANGVVYANTDIYFTALDARSGALLWSFERGGYFEAFAGWPVVANGVVYIGSYCLYPFQCSDGYLNAFSLNGQ